MEKKKATRKKKTLDITIDTKNVDLTIKRDEDGNVHAELDTPRVDVTVDKTAEGTSVDIEIDDDKEYQFISNGTAKTLPKGTLWRITGAMLKIFLKKGYGKIK